MKTGKNKIKHPQRLPPKACERKKRGSPILPDHGCLTLWSDPEEQAKPKSDPKIHRF
jgi:hypothetical protein